MTRLLDLFGSDLSELRGDALIDAIRRAEGRTVMAEIVAGEPPLVAGVSNPELACAFGADLVCLNLVDSAGVGVLVGGLEDLVPSPTGLRGLSRLLGRPVGINLEPEMSTVPDAFRATADAARAASCSGAAFVVITANPKRGARIADIAAAVDTVREAAPQLVCFAGKMHGAGAEDSLTPGTAISVLDAGARGVLVPLPGTVPGMSEADAAAMVATAHERGALAIGTMGTSQEGSDPETVRSLALAGKRAGVDVHHVGDSGFRGIAVPENLYAYSVTIRGIRHTWSRMARGVRASWSERGN
jgi:hypothetical protein